MEADTVQHDPTSFSCVTSAKTMDAENDVVGPPGKSLWLFTGTSSAKDQHFHTTPST
jgi:hypothetical protein